MTLIDRKVAVHIYQTGQTKKRGERATTASACGGDDEPRKEAALPGPVTPRSCDSAVAGSDHLYFAISDRLLIED